MKCVLEFFHDSSAVFISGTGYSTYRGVVNFEFIGGFIRSLIIEILEFLMLVFNKHCTWNFLKVAKFFLNFNIRLYQFVPINSLVIKDKFFFLWAIL